MNKNKRKETDLIAVIITAEARAPQETLMTLILEMGPLCLRRRKIFCLSHIL